MEFKRSTKKRDIYYLIEAFLIENGYRESAECLRCEAELSNEYAVCDNISLETIIIEFEIFYYQRFKTHPKLCKTIDCRFPMRTAKRSKPIAKKCSTDTNSPSNIPTLKSDLILCNSFKKYSDSKNETADEEVTALKEFHAIILQNINAPKNYVQWQDVKGVNEVKELLKEAIIYPIKYPYLFTGGVLEPWKSILMFGPPGTGKTLLANAVATESNATFFNISSSLIVNKWRGDTEKLIKVLFELASEKAPSIIFIDEIDALALKRNVHEHEASRRMKSELFFGIDKLMKSTKNILLLATTNTPWDLDAAMLRRFEKHIYVPPPDEETRKSLLQHFLPKTISTDPIIEVDFDYDCMTKMTEKYTGCDIRNICKNIKMNFLREVFSNLESNSAKQNATIQKSLTSRENFENIFKKFKPIFIHSEDMYLKWTNEHDHK